MILLLLACNAEDPTPPQPALGPWTQVVPGDGLPSEITPQQANNNLDVTWHDGEVFLAFRTAPDHFASDQVRLYAARSADEQTWTFEGEWFMATDLREPRLLSWDGRLFLYFAVLGTDRLDFEPQGTMVTIREPDGTWTEPAWLFQNGFIPWRVRVVDGVPMMIGYTGGDDIYDVDELPAIEVQWLRSGDGLSWEPVVPGQPTVETGGGSETDFAILEDGAVVAVTRNEAGDELGWGSKVCRAEADALGDWRCEPDPRKYDSPLVFTASGRVWLIGRRNVTEDGHYDLGRRDMDHQDQTLHYEIAYWQEPKRCALWEVDPDALSVEFVMDLPSRGDTCFPSALPLGEDRFAIYNYTSDPEGPDISWLDGQNGPTVILRQELGFE
ncbi:MAG: hypothetical protein H6739_15955 [Alphaproteobacteria bacterium]|nr:hypothetical protein [Alphaproteobacteria bacterium]